MSSNPFRADSDRLYKLKESISGIEKDIKYMNSELKSADMDDLSMDDKDYVYDNIKEGERAIWGIKEYYNLTNNYVNSFGGVRLQFGYLSDSERGKLMKSVGRKYEEIYDHYLNMWGMFEAMAKFHYVTKIKLQKYVK